MKTVLCAIVFSLLLTSVSFADNSTTTNDEWTANIINAAREKREKEERNDMLLKSGYSHGCTSGNFAGGNVIGNSFTKNTKLYIEEPYYKTGWDDGYMNCKSMVDTFNPFRR